MSDTHDFVVELAGIPPAPALRPAPTPTPETGETGPPNEPAPPAEDTARKRRRRGRSKPATSASPDQAELPLDAGTDEEADAAPAVSAVAPASADGPLIEVFGWHAGAALPQLPEGGLLVDEALAEPFAIACPERPFALLPRQSDDLQARLDSASDPRICLVIDGDPVTDGPGRGLLATLGPARVQLHAATGALQRAMARIGVALGETTVLPLGRVGLGGLAARLRRGHLYAMSPGGVAPQAIGEVLEACGFHQARVWLVEPGAEGRVHALLGFELSDCRLEFPPGCHLAVYTAACDGSSREWPGIPAAELRQALPEAARLLALAWLQPGGDETGWSIEPEEPALALDWSRARPGAELHAIGVLDEELEPLREAHGAGEGLRAVPSGSFRSLEQLPDPQLVFIRAGEEFTQQVRTSWERLSPGGRMVVAAEDEQSRLELMQFAHRLPPLHWQDLDIACGSREGTRARLAPPVAVRLMAWRKPPRG